MNLPLPVLLVGIHGHGRSHLRKLLPLVESGAVRLAGVCDTDPPGPDDNLEGHGPVPAFTDLDQALKATKAQVTIVVTFWVELSSKVPVAVNWTLVPLAIDGVAGVTAIDVSVAPVTVRVVMPLMAPLVAVMTVVPAATPEASPPAEIVAVAAVPEDHVTMVVRSFVDPSS